MLYSNTWNGSIVCKQMTLVYVKYYMQTIFLLIILFDVYVYKQDLALNNLYELVNFTIHQTNHLFNIPNYFQGSRFREIFGNNVNGSLAKDTVDISNRFR